MNIAFAKTFQSNTYVESMYQLLDQHQGTVDCLIVAHNDPEMIRRLTEAMQDQALAVLPVSQADWDNNLPAIIAAAVDSGIDHVLIAGHSNGIQLAEPTLVNSGAPSTGKQLPAGGVNRVFTGACQTEYQLDASKKHFINQLSQLSESEELADLECSDEFRLNSIFFVANGGAFLRYNISDHTFTSLV